MEAPDLVGGSSSSYTILIQVICGFYRLRMGPYLVGPGPYQARIWSVQVRIRIVSGPYRFRIGPYRVRIRPFKFFLKILPPTWTHISLTGGGPTDLRSVDSCRKKNNTEILSHKIKQYRNPFKINISFFSSKTLSLARWRYRRECCIEVLTFRLPTQKQCRNPFSQNKTIQESF